jgi:hypothetical protein
MEAILKELDVFFLADFLKANQMPHPLVHVSLCRTEEEVDTNFAEPFTGGAKIGTVDVKSTEPADITRAVLRAVWKRCSGNTTPTTNSTPTSTTASSSAETKNKVPRKLPAGVWQQQIQIYNKTLLGGATRCFPDQMIYGAEVTLARIWREETANECFTNISLGEIIVAQAFTSTAGYGQSRCSHIVQGRTDDV